MDCVFCRIVAGEIPAELVLRDEHVTVFHDIAPVAPTHLVVVPNRHVPTLDDLQDSALAAQLLAACAAAASAVGLTRGYRVVANVGPDADQIVPHLHLHVLGGRPMAWPPG